MITYPKNYSFIGTTLISLFLAIIIFYPYIQTEVFGVVHSKEFDVDRLCRKLQNTDFKTIKIINLEKHRGFAKIYCLFNDTGKNYSLTLYYVEDSWKVEYFRSLNTGFYWPIYY